MLVPVQEEDVPVLDTVRAAAAPAAAAEPGVETARLVLELIVEDSAAVPALETVSGPEIVITAAAVMAAAAAVADPDPGVATAKLILAQDAAAAGLDTASRSEIV